MTKPLHRLLRWLSIYPREEDIFWILGNRYDCEQSLPTICEHLATEIESEYIPLLCDSDGKPWKLREECVCNGYTWTIDGFDDSEVLIGRILDDGCDTVVTKWENPLNLKRPTPPVLDADGVEIKVGDVVYLADEDGSVEFIVEALPAPNFYQAVQVVSGRFYTSYDPPRLTHEKPVFDANGVRICKGDTVWHVYTGQKATVTTVYRDDKKRVEVKIAGHLMDYDPSDLTHQEPDSFTKAMDRFQSILEDKDGLDHETEDKLWKVHKRLASLIEKDAR